ncbi:MAG: Inositol polyphosphate kinase [Lasallia pustulata]|uniref:Kinase n=1 Tax=Lasallia pustulata TaxID=136370 RepID=A0A5M8PLR1_9LECA|nr:MAG: Inositol polyphosphate kinase [Lasallia pustulata]
MPQFSLRHSQLIEFDNSAAGHEGVLSDKSGDFIVKPCKQAEIDFYDTTASHPYFARFIPTYYGRLKLQGERNTTLAANSLPIPMLSDHEPADVSLVLSTITADPTWVPTGGGQIDTDEAVALENVAAGFQKPNILDVKLGARLWADDAPPAKRAKLDKVAEETTSRTLGLRIAGMKTWLGPAAAGKGGAKQDGYRTYGKSYGKNLKANEIYQGFRSYFLTENAGVTKILAKKVINRFIRDLEDFQDMLEREESRMYSSSLLFIYEGDGNALEEAINEELNGERRPLEAANGMHMGADNEEESDESEDYKDEHSEDEDEDEDGEEVQWPKVQVVKLIDFAHASWTPGQGPDLNLLHGVKNLIQIFGDLVADL